MSYVVCSKYLDKPIINVQEIIADCRYTSASAENKHILNQLPDFSDEKFK